MVRSDKRRYFASVRLDRSPCVGILYSTAAYLLRTSYTRLPDGRSVIGLAQMLCPGQSGRMPTRISRVGVGRGMPKSNPCYMIGEEHMPGLGWEPFHFGSRSHLEHRPRPCLILQVRGFPSSNKICPWSGTLFSQPMSIALWTQAGMIPSVAR